MSPGHGPGAVCYRSPVIELRFHGGTLELHFPREATGKPLQRPSWLPASCLWDPRAHVFRAPAMAYHEVVRALHGAGVAYDDRARAYETLPSGARFLMEPRPFQREAIDAWKGSGGRGVVVLPTGAGKTHVAIMAIHARARSALVVAPTLDLVRQWYDRLREAFQIPVGVVGGGEHRVEALTVTTYDSAHIHMEHLGNRFGLVIFDECHHLPSEAYGSAAESCLAPFRLGLTATPERQDGREGELERLLGPIVYRQEIVALSGEYLASYETRRIKVQLSAEEQEAWAEARGIYLDFVRAQGISMGSRDGFRQFLMRASQSEPGREALHAYRAQRAIAFAADAKLEYLDLLLHVHRQDRMLIFTIDNATAYKISRRFLIPVITHQTKVTERSDILSGLAEGRYRAVVTSRVLNEGVDVPEANVAVVVSGTGSVREHVQRLGRILRKREGKTAVLYELVTEGTAEAHTSERRREHVAYR